MSIAFLLSKALSGVHRDSRFASRVDSVEEHRELRDGHRDVPSALVDHWQLKAVLLEPVMDGANPGRSRKKIYLVAQLADEDEEMNVRFECLSDVLAGVQDHPAKAIAELPPGACAAAGPQAIARQPS